MNFLKRLEMFYNLFWVEVTGVHTVIKTRTVHFNDISTKKVVKKISPI